MPGNFLIRFLFLPFFVMSASHAQPPVESLDSFLWEKRILLIDGIRQDSEAVTSMLESGEAGIEERHIAWFVIGPDAVLSNLPVPLAGSFRETLWTEFFEEEESKRVVLIGKDGGVKAVYKKLDLEAIFIRIDGMPMRRAEMRRQ